VAGSAARARSALLVVDFINPALGRRAGQFARRALKAAQYTAELGRRARRAGMPVIYANDHFGNWQSDFSALIDACRRGASCSREVIRLIEPGPRDYTVLKPRHSAFYGALLHRAHVHESQPESGYPRFGFGLESGSRGTGGLQ